MTFKFIDHNDSLLEKVIDLGKKNSQTLGLMPKDAYIQQARKKCIVVACDQSRLLGFCLFRLVTTKNRIGITQVCIAKEHRRKGISKLLLDQIRDKYKLLFSGMIVSCREDYNEALALWDSYGFIKKKRVRSRSTQEHYLFKLWYNFGLKDLFSVEATTDSLRVVLDLNILIKLRDQDKEDEEVDQLLSDWLIDDVEYWYAKETLNEIHRDRDYQRTNKTIQFLSQFQELTCNPIESQQFYSALEALHPGSTENHISDRKQLAECKASGISYFITADEELISNRDRIFEEIGVNILGPSEFILEIDELKNRRLYEPLRLQGARYEVKRISSNELVSVIDSFLNKELSEKKSHFQKLVLSSTADTKNSICKVITSPEGDIVAIYGLRFESECINVEFIRLKKVLISNTLFNQILVEVIYEAINLKKIKIKLSEKNISNEQREILSNHGFYKSSEEWEKLALPGLLHSSELLTRYPIIKEQAEFASVVNLISSEADNELKENLKLSLERKLWPLKFIDLSIPVFIVPIKPIWASQLFDHISSNESLFGAAPELSWSKENVYYRSLHPNVESFPGRILWYASDEKGFRRKKAIVGCSYLNNVIIGEAKNVFSSFRRYGIYKWPEIKKLAKGDIHRLIKVLQFSDTEVFDKPVTFAAVNSVLLGENFKAQTFVSPVKVNNKVFNSVYKLAKGTE